MDEEFPNLAKDALLHARALAAAKDDRDPETLDLLAAAYAANGQVLEAVATAEKGLRLAEEAGDRAWADRIRYRLGLYRQGRTPYQPRGEPSASPRKTPD